MNYKFIFLTTLFVSCLLASNILASKLVVAWGLILPAAVFIFPITFLLTDTINEVWGKKQAQLVVYTGFVMSLIFVAFTTLGQHLPPAPIWKHQRAYEIILGSVPRIVLASMVAYLVSQLHDVWAFNYWKITTHGRFLWLRNNLSTIISQLIDSSIFITIAFLGTVPPDLLLTMVLSQYLVKVVFSIADTPFIYIAVKWARK